MNKNEYWQTVNKHTDPVYKKVHGLLEEWKVKNNIPAETHCCVHHRDDTEECIKYNEAHYECWGVDENGDFVEGKYVIFMTRSEHSRYHATGKNAFRCNQSENICNKEDCR